MLHYENFDFDNIVTPVNVRVCEKLLKESNYDPKEISYLVDGFANGFLLEFEGNREVKKLAPNLKLNVGNPIQLWNKVMVEVEKGCYAGPFKEVPFEYFIQSPIGLVPKDKGAKTRLIFHLSYPKMGDSVNSQIPKQACSVQYSEFDIAVKMCIEAGKACHIGKSDMSAAFRNIGMAKSDWPLMVMKATNPNDGQVYYFVDKCMSFGSSISCTIFQRFSNAVAHLVTFRTKKRTLNYLDDFFFVALLKYLRDGQLRTFLDVCKEINFPVALEKTFWGSTLMTFLGLLIYTEKGLICIPIEKLIKANELMDKFLSRKSGKVKVLEVQKLCGFLNFLCRSVVPGRVFLRRLCACTSGSKLKPHHHIKLTGENKLDLMLWKSFLTYPEAVARSFMDFKEITSEDIDLYSDASRNFELGFGAYCGSEWSYGQWNKDFMKACEPSIEYLELFAITVGVLNWIKIFKNRRVTSFCDNESVVYMINNAAAKCKRCMVLLRIITLEGMIHNVRIQAKHVRTEKNGKADALSRLDFKRFRKLGPNMNLQPSPIPECLWPMNKVWMN